MHDERMGRLPRWAQDHIKALEQNVVYYKAQARQACGEEPSNVALEVYEGAGRVTKPLPLLSRVVFTLRDGAEITAGIVNNYVEVRTDRDSLAVQPQAANVAKVSAARWW